MCQAASSQWLACTCLTSNPAMIIFLVPSNDIASSCVLLQAVVLIMLDMTGHKSIAVRLETQPSFHSEPASWFQRLQGIKDTARHKRRTVHAGPFTLKPWASSSRTVLDPTLPVHPATNTCTACLIAEPEVMLTIAGLLQAQLNLLVQESTAQKVSS